jgi:hypothetical protein
MLIILNLHVKIKVSNAYATSCIKKDSPKNKKWFDKDLNKSRLNLINYGKIYSNFLETIMSKTIITKKSPTLYGFYVLIC